MIGSWKHWQPLNKNVDKPNNFTERKVENLGESTFFLFQSVVFCY